jgi:hypothetical protein
MEQNELERAAAKYVENKYGYTKPDGIKDFKAGAEWQKERDEKLDANELMKVLAKLSIARRALIDISRWDDDMEEEWGDPGERSLEALNLIK